MKNKGGTVEWWKINKISLFHQTDSEHQKWKAVEHERGFHLFHLILKIGCCPDSLENKGVPLFHPFHR